MTGGDYNSRISVRKQARSAVAITEHILGSKPHTCADITASLHQCLTLTESTDPWSLKTRVRDIIENAMHLTQGQNLPYHPSEPG